VASLFSQYIQQREGKSIIETDIGFATYSFTNDSVYIEDIFVVEEHRDSGEASKMADAIVAEAKERGCKKLYGSVSPSARGSTSSLKVLLAYGFKLESASNNFIVFSKGIE